MVIEFIGSVVLWEISKMIAKDITGYFTKHKTQSKGAKDD